MSKSEFLSEDGSRFARSVDWNLFKLFYEIGRSGGIGAAARLVNKQQPSVSAALKRLESQVGAQLCVRTSRGIDLTPAGHQLFSFCMGMYSSVQNVPSAASMVRGDYSGVVTLRVISHLVIPELNAGLREFHQRYPKIEIKLDVAPWRLVLKSLKNGEVELGIGFDSAPSAELVYTSMLEETQQLYCGPKHPLFGQSDCALEMLRDETFVLAGEEENDELARYRRRHGLGHRVAGIADNVQERMLLVQLGIGIGFLPQAVVQSSSAATQLWPLLAPPDAPSFAIYFMARANCARSAPAQLLLDTMLGHLPSQRQPQSRTA